MGKYVLMSLSNWSGQLSHKFILIPNPCTKYFQTEILPASNALNFSSRLLRALHRQSQQSRRGPSQWVGLGKPPAIGDRAGGGPRIPKGQACLGSFRNIMALWLEFLCCCVPLSATETEPYSAVARAASARCRPSEHIPLPWLYLSWCPCSWWSSSFYSWSQPPCTDHLPWLSGTPWSTSPCLFSREPGHVASEKRKPHILLPSMSTVSGLSSLSSCCICAIAQEMWIRAKIFTPQLLCSPVSEIQTHGGNWCCWNLLQRSLWEVGLLSKKSPGPILDKLFSLLEKQILYIFKTHYK